MGVVKKFCVICEIVLFDISWLPGLISKRDIIDTRYKSDTRVTP